MEGEAKKLDLMFSKHLDVQYGKSFCGESLLVSHILLQMCVYLLVDQTKSNDGLPGLFQNVDPM